jgi:hypothetical protein
MKHTPGPWQYESRPLGSAIAKDGYCLATAHGTIAIKGGQWPHEANARLIAAAPDLLDAAERAEWWLSTISGSEAIRAVLRAAIAKAEGK